MHIDTQGARGRLDIGVTMEDLASWQSKHEGKNFGSRMFLFQAALRDGERLFLLTFKTHAEVDGLPDIAADYLRTFRFESKHSKKQHVHPSGRDPADDTMPTPADR